MKKQLLFVGNKFTLNRAFQRYILREVERKTGHPDAVFFFGESDNSLFLQLEKALSLSQQLLIVATKSSFPVIGKLLSTITSDNQVLMENMLIPSHTIMFEEGSYLLHHDDTAINVLLAEEGKELPRLLVEDDNRTAVIHIFEEELDAIQALLGTLTQTYDVTVDYSRVVEGWSKLQIHGRRYGNISQFIAAVKQLFSKKVIAASNIGVYIIERLTQSNRKVTFAESCTGGLLATFLTRESGASNVFDGSLVTYSNALKANWLAVSDTILENPGAVSAPVVEEMTDGALNVSYADYAIAVSGIAGPDGGTEFKPVGTVFIAARSKERVTVEECHFNGDRNYVQEQSTYYALKMLLLLDKETFFE